MHFPDSNEVVGIVEMHALRGLCYDSLFKTGTLEPEWCRYWEILGYFDKEGTYSFVNYVGHLCLCVEEWGVLGFFLTFSSTGFTIQSVDLNCHL